MAKEKSARAKEFMESRIQFLVDFAEKQRGDYGLDTSFVDRQLNVIKNLFETYEKRINDDDKKDLIKKLNEASKKLGSELRFT